jgi:hypothetical protein
VRRFSAHLSLPYVASRPLGYGLLLRVMIMSILHTILITPANVSALDNKVITLEMRLSDLRLWQW